VTRNNMRKPPVNGVYKRMVSATQFSIKGLSATWKNEEAFRLEVITASILIPASFLLDVSSNLRLLMITSIVIVIICELFNTAIESVVDRIGHEDHVLSGQAKDIGSSTVFISCMLVVLIWGTAIYNLLITQ